MNEEVQKEIAEIVDGLLAVCNGHSFAVNKAALQFARDHLIKQESLSEE